MILQKLKPRTQDEIINHLIKHEFSLVELSRMLEFITNSFEFKSILNENSAKESKVASRSTSGAFSGAKPKHFRCCFCQQTPRSSECTSFVSQKKRREWAKVNGICFNCLKYRHMVRDCELISTYRHCKTKHRTLLCFWEYSKAPMNVATAFIDDDGKL